MLSNTAHKAAISANESGLDGVRERLAREPTTLFAILDACDEPRIPAKVLELGDRAESLYRGRAEEEHWAIAPYLVQVDEPLLDWIVEALSGTPWGILAFAATDLDSLRKHFRRFLKVEGPDGQKLYFRFYDPRVLPTFLNSCGPEEAIRFFGPVDTYLVFNDDSQLLSFTGPTR